MHDLLEVLDTNKTQDCFERCFPSCFSADMLPWGLVCTECCLTSNVVWISCSGWIAGLATCFFSVKTFRLGLLVFLLIKVTSGPERAP